MNNFSTVTPTNLHQPKPKPRATRKARNRDFVLPSQTEVDAVYQQDDPAYQQIEESMEIEVEEASTASTESLLLRVLDLEEENRQLKDSNKQLKDENESKLLGF